MGAPAASGDAQPGGVTTPRGAARPREDLGGPSSPAKAARTVQALEAATLDEPLSYEMLEDLPEHELSVPDGQTAASTAAGKKEALEMLTHYGVFEDIPESDSGSLKMLRARWEPQARKGEEGVKWRYVAQEFKWMEDRDDCFAASSSAATSRLVDFVALKEGRASFVGDCVKAYYQAEQTEAVCVRPPREHLLARAAAGLRTDVVWRLKRMLPGQRVAGAGWVATAAKKLTAQGFERNPACPQFFYRERDKALLEVHMDDFHGCVPPEGGEAVLSELREMFDLKAGDAVMHGRYQHLKREMLRLEDRTLIRPK